MRLKYGRRLLAIGLLLLFMMSISGCTGNTGAEAPETGSVNTAHEEATDTLLILSEDLGDQNRPWVVQLSRLVQAFEKNHAGVQIEVEYLPYKDAEAREIALDQWRTRIMAGKGPDIYLLPTSGRPDREPLFFDVYQSMCNGIFMDISENYDADDALGKESLNATIMDAGVIGDARYVLPLRYDIPIVYVNEDQFEATGLSTDMFSSGIVNLLETVIALDDPKLAEGTIPSGASGLPLFYYFPNVVDYETREVLLSKEELVAFIENVQANRVLQGSTFDVLNKYLLSFEVYMWQSLPFWMNEGYSFALSSLDKVIHEAALARVEGKAVQMLPFPTSDGSVVANVTCFGAIGNGCENVELAYEFLRQYLSEDIQWEVDQPSSMSSDAKMVEAGYPVRTEGSVSPLHQSFLRRASAAVGGSTPEEEQMVKERLEKLKEVTLTDEDVPVLQTQIDKVRFLTSDEYVWAQQILVDLNDWQTGAAVDVDIDALAEEILDELYWSLHEG